MILLATLVCACQQERHPSFSTPQEAVTALRQTLSSLQRVTDVKPEAAAFIIADWRLLKDSVYAAFERDTVMVRTNPALATAYLNLEDSIIKEINRIFSIQKFSLSDITTIKINSAQKYSTLRQSDTFHQAITFYDAMDTTPVYADAETTLHEYDLLLQTDTLKTEGDLYTFIQKEDRCFRSLLAHLTAISQDDLQTIAEQTSRLLDGLYSTVIARPDNETNKRLLIYLTLRYNRRILQNADACMDDVLNEKELTSEQIVNYRWMLIQPYIALDFFSSSLLTEQQAERLTTIAAQLPKLLLIIDGGTITDDAVNGLAADITDYSLKTFLITSL